MKTFNQKCWDLAKKIPKGKVTTYKIIAEKLNTKAYRAVGTAFRNNLFAPKVPCHRVINSSGKVGSYKGKKNSEEKIRLLRKEGIEIKKGRIIGPHNVIYRF